MYAATPPDRQATIKGMIDAIPHVDVDEIKATMQRIIKEISNMDINEFNAMQLN